MIGLLLVFLVLLLLAFTPKFALVVYLYLFNSVLYTKFFKSYPVLEMFLVAVGFVLRLIAGALALNLALSEWFLIVGGFGALYIVSIKRLAELKQENLREVRKVINSYSSDFLNFVAYSSSSVTLTSYCLWAFDQVSKPFWYQISVLPFMIALFRFGWISDRKSIEVPEDTILHDRPMLFSSTVLIATLSIAVF
jgi:decaprenyl-phosphate phosphoribosyltransferase